MKKAKTKQTAPNIVLRSLKWWKSKWKSQCSPTCWKIDRLSLSGSRQCERPKRSTGREWRPWKMPRRRLSPATESQWMGDLRSRQLFPWRQSFLGKKKKKGWREGNTWNKSVNKPLQCLLNHKLSTSQPPYLQKNIGSLLSPQVCALVSRQETPKTHVKNNSYCMQRVLSLKMCSTALKLDLSPKIFDIANLKKK